MFAPPAYCIRHHVFRLEKVKNKALNFSSRYFTSNSTYFFLYIFFFSLIRYMMLFNIDDAVENNDDYTYYKTPTKINILHFGMTI